MNTELISYEEAFPDVHPVRVRRSQRIKRTGIIANIPQSIRIAQQTNTCYIIDISTRFQFEIQKLLTILQVAVVDKNKKNIVIPYQPTEFQLAKIYQVIPVDISVIAKTWNEQDKETQLKEQTEVPTIQQLIPRPIFNNATFTTPRNTRPPSVQSVVEEIERLDLKTPKTPPPTHWTAKEPRRRVPVRTPSPDENDPEYRAARKAFKAMGFVGRGKPKIKVREPEVYDGKKRGLAADQFIESCKLYFLVKKDDFDSEQTMIVFAISYLSDVAKTWASPILRDILGKQKKKESRRWEVFEEEFVKAFGDPDKEAAAIRALEALIAKGQKGPATQYAADFRRTTMEIDWDEGTFIHYYRRGLKEEVKDALVYHPRPKDLETLINLSIRLDERIWERKQEKSNEHQPRPPPRPQPRPPTNPFPAQQYQAPLPQPQLQVFRANPNQQAPNAFAHNQPVPIHIDANRRGPPSAEEKAKRGAEGRCYYCGQAGHRASNHNLPPRPCQGVIDATIAATVVPSPSSPLPDPNYSPTPSLQSNNPFSQLAQQGFLPSV